MITRGQLADFRAAIEGLPDGELSQADVLDESFLVAREKRLSVDYAPFDHINRSARVVLLGLTPGWRQTQIANEVFRDARKSGSSQHEAMRAVKANASFAGMRKRLSGWLDELGLARQLGLRSTASLFTTDQPLLHTTSLVRYPVFVGPAARNYTGHGPAPVDSRILMSIVSQFLVPELATLSSALVVPMGRAASTTLEKIGVETRRCLFGFPHPSGANAHGPREFRDRRAAMKAVVASMSIS